MRRVMAEHRYDLQYVFYILALHRQLRARLPDYDYDQHIGGALYWFVRGIESDTGGLWQDRPRRSWPAPRRRVRMSWPTARWTGCLPVSLNGRLAHDE